jgi:hypothetical protein
LKQELHHRHKRTLIFKKKKVNVHKDSVPTSQRTQFVSITNISHSCRITCHCESQAEHISILGGQNTELLVLHLVVRGVISGLERATAVYMWTGCFILQQYHSEAVNDKI